jgi:hypothetical protein
MSDCLSISKGPIYDMQCETLLVTVIIMNKVYFRIDHVITYSALKLTASLVYFQTRNLVLATTTSKQMDTTSIIMIRFVAG